VSRLASFLSGLEVFASRALAAEMMRGRKALVVAHSFKMKVNGANLKGSRVLTTV